VINPPAFDPRLFTDIARNLAGQQPPEEGRFRTAVGRAYYSLFLIARENLRIRVREDVHSAVIRSLRAQNRRLGDQLDQLRHYRVVADYELIPDDPTKQNWEQNWNYVWQLATRLRPTLEGIRPAPARP